MVASSRNSTSAKSMMQSLFRRKSTVQPQFSGEAVGTMWYLPSSSFFTKATTKSVAARKRG